MDDGFIAHRRESDGKVQTICDHLQEVATICAWLTDKIKLPDAGRLLGLLHDFGKYSLRFYFLGSNWRRRVEHVGAKEAIDQEGPLII